MTTSLATARREVVEHDDPSGRLPARNGVAPGSFWPTPGFGRGPCAGLGVAAARRDRLGGPCDRDPGFRRRCTPAARAAGRAPRDRGGARGSPRRRGAAPTALRALPAWARRPCCGRPLAAATESGFLVLDARGGELEQSFPFGVVGQLFAADRPRRQGAGERRGSPSRGRAVRGVGAGARPGSPPRDADFAVLNALYWLCGNLCEQLAGAACRGRCPLGRRGVAAVSLLPRSPWRWDGPGARGSRAHGRARGRCRSLRRARTRAAPSDRAWPAERGRGLRSGAGAVVGGRERRALPGVSRGDARQRVSGRAGHRRASSAASPSSRSRRADVVRRRRAEVIRPGSWHGSPAGTGRQCAGGATAVCSGPGPSPSAPPRSARLERRIEPEPSPKQACGRARDPRAPGACSIRPSPDQDLDLRRDRGRDAAPRSLRREAARGRGSPTPGRSPRVCFQPRGTATQTRSRYCSRPQPPWLGAADGPSTICDVLWRTAYPRPPANSTVRGSAQPRQTPTIRPLLTHSTARGGSPPTEYCERGCR